MQAAATHALETPAVRRTEQGYDLGFTISERAWEMAKKRVAEASDESPIGLRLGVRGGGCSGYAYVIDFAKKIREKRDFVFELDGLTVVVDRRSYDVLKGSTLSWETHLMGYGFRWKNPAASATCGCGTSFDVQQA